MRESGVDGRRSAVRELLGLLRGHDLTCAEVKTMTDGHVADIRRKVKDLKKFERVLADLSAQCSGDAVLDDVTPRSLSSGDWNTVNVGLLVG